MSYAVRVCGECRNQSLALLASTRDSDASDTHTHTHTLTHQDNQNSEERRCIISTTSRDYTEEAREGMARRVSGDHKARQVVGVGTQLWHAIGWDGSTSVCVSDSCNNAEGPPRWCHVAWPQNFFRSIATRLSNVCWHHWSQPHPLLWWKQCTLQATIWAEFRHEGEDGWRVLLVVVGGSMQAMQRGRLWITRLDFSDVDGIWKSSLRCCSCTHEWEKRGWWVMVSAWVSLCVRCQSRVVVSTQA